MKQPHYSLAHTFATALHQAPHLSALQKRQWAHLSAYMTKTEIEEAIALLNAQAGEVQTFLDKFEEKVLK